MKRRTFLAHSIAGAVGACAAAMPEDLEAKRARIAVSSYSFHNYFPSTRDEDFRETVKPLDVLQFAEMIADRYHLHNLEIVAPHFESRSAAYIKEVNARLKKTHSRIVNIPIDIGELWDQPGLSAADEKTRERALALYKPWFDFAQAVGAQSVRCDPGKINTAKLEPTLASYRTLCAYGQQKGLKVTIENHYGVGSEHPEELVRIFREVGGNLRALPDFGNFPDQPTRERGLRLLFPVSGPISHARDTESDHKGGLARFDLGQCVRIAKQAGYQGVFSVEAEARGDAYANVQHVYDELLKFV